ncbi:MFS transporter [Myxococcota bacterium]|nr:MFS transporter [Myxococcota bacterium]MBU1431857.1 MFS transporter [Myxococcota bacterium]MBU1898997.1 MFS transporter [Myxococcota bacterium]
MSQAKHTLIQITARYRRWRMRIFFTAWSMYATYYMARVNISVAVPSLQDLLGEGGQATEHSIMLVGLILTGTKLAYGFGQLINGILGDRFGPRRVATIGMGISALMNLLFGLVGSFPAFMGIWLVNGLSQATGAPSRIKLLANWFSPTARGKMMGLLGTDYMVGNALSWILSGWLLERYGWRYVFFVPAAILAVSAAHVYWRTRNAPEEVGLPTIEDFERLKAGEMAIDEVRTEAREDEHAGWAYVARQALLNKHVWIVGFAYFGVDLFRYGFLDWSFAYLMEQDPSVGKAVIKIIMLPIVGAVGIIASGWLTDRMEGRRAPVIAVMLIISAGLAWVFRSVPAGHFWYSLLILGGIGFFLYGPHLLMGATIAMDLGSRKASATASGVIDWLGYMGAAVAGVGTAWARNRWGWDGAFYLWIASALLAAALMLTLWNVKPSKDQEFV